MTNSAHPKRTRMEIISILTQGGENVGPIAQTFGKTVKGVIEKTGKDGQSLVDGLSPLIQDCIEEALRQGGDLGKLLKGMALGLLRQFSGEETEAWRALNNMGSVVILKTIQEGGDLERSSLDFLRGTIQGAKERHWGPEEAAQVAAHSIMRSAYDVGGNASGELIRETLSGTISGVSLHLEKPEHV